jgi:hypothetical protein
LAVRGVLSDNDAPLVSWTSLRLLGRDKPVVSSVVPDWCLLGVHKSYSKLLEPQGLSTLFFYLLML